MKKPTPDPIAWGALTAALFALFLVLWFVSDIYSKLDALPTVTTSGHGMEVRK